MYGGFKLSIEGTYNTSPKTPKRRLKAVCFYTFGIQACGQRLFKSWPQTEEHRFPDGPPQPLAFWRSVAIRQELDLQRTLFL